MPAIRKVREEHLADLVCSHDSGSLLTDGT